MQHPPKRSYSLKQALAARLAATQQSQNSWGDSKMADVEPTPTAQQDAPMTAEEIARLRAQEHVTAHPDAVVQARLIATVAALDAEIEAREQRRLDVLEWLQERIGTAWECDNCHHSTYHVHNFECAECGTEMPIEHALAFKLHAAVPDPDGRPEPSDRAALPPPQPDGGGNG